MDTILQKIRGLLEVEEVKGGIDSKTLFTRIEIDLSKNDIKTWAASGTDNVEIKVSGDYIAKELYSGNQGDASFKLQSQHGRELKFNETRKAYGKFNKIYVSNRFKESGTGDTTGKIIFLVGYLIGGEVEPADSGKDSILDVDGKVINPAKEDGNLATIAGLDGIDGGGDLQKIKEELESVNTDLVAIKVLIMAGNVDIAALEVDLAAIEAVNIAIRTAVEVIDNAICGTKMLTQEQFTGVPFNKQQTSTDSMVVLHGYTKKLRDVVIKNTDATHAVDIGITQVNVAAFRANSFELKAGSSIGFTMINLNLLEILSSVEGNHAAIHLIGTEV